MRLAASTAGSLPAIERHDDTEMNMKRMRNRGHRNGGGGPIRHHGGGGGAGGIPLNRNHVFDSNGPDLRIRGTAQQLFEKYLQLGRDATSSGDRVMAEGYFQHAEHYFRILNAMNQAAQQNQQQNGQQHQPRRQYNGEDNTPAPIVAEQEEGAAPGTGDQPETKEIPIVAATSEN